MFCVEFYWAVDCLCTVIILYTAWALLREENTCGGDVTLVLRINEARLAKSL